MAEKTNLEEPLRRAIEANLRYYEALGKVTQDYVSALLGVFKDLPLRISLPLTSTKQPTTSQPKPAPGSASPSAATLVLEADAGAEAMGVFLVENRLNRTVSTAVMTSAFADPSGRAITPTLRVVPGVVTLEPGGRTFVQIIALVSTDLEPDVPYRGEVTVPGLADHGIPVLLRRRANAMMAATAAPVSGRSAPASHAPARSKSRRKSKSSSKSKRGTRTAAAPAAATPDTPSAALATKRASRTKRRTKRSRRPSPGGGALD